jgi:hypothetical protein
MLRPRRFFDALVSATWIKKPNLKNRTGRLDSRPVQLDVIIIDYRVSSCEGGRHIGSQSNGQHDERHCRDRYHNIFEHDPTLGKPPL